MLTGTPLQNDLEELQNLLSFLLPDVFHADVAAQLADEQARAAGPFKIIILNLLSSLLLDVLTAVSLPCERSRAER